MTDIELKRKEAKTLTFTIKDSNGVVIDVSNPTTVEFAVKDSLDAGTTIILKVNADFDKTLASSGIVKVNLSTTNTDNVGNFIGELKITFSGTNIDKSDYITIRIREAVTT
jgi:hypothetical protein